MSERQATGDQPEDTPNRRPEASGGSRKGRTGRSGAREAVALLLASGATQEATAAQTGVSVRAIRDWLGQPEFAARVREIRSAMMSAALGRLTAGMTGASDALTALVGDDSPDVRFKAAKTVVELTLKVREQTDLAERLARVEAMLVGGAADGRADTRQAAETGSGGGDAGRPPGPTADDVEGGSGDANG